MDISCTRNGYLLPHNGFGLQHHGSLQTVTSLLRIFFFIESGFERLSASSSSAIVLCFSRQRQIEPQQLKNSTSINKAFGIERKVHHQVRNLHSALSITTQLSSNFSFNKDLHQLDDLHAQNSTFSSQDLQRTPSPAVPLHSINSFATYNIERSAHDIAAERAQNQASLTKRNDGLSTNRL